MIPSVNFHLWQPCNMRCKFCYATFQDVKKSILPKGHLPKEQAIDVVRHLAAHGFEKITFAGGEPTLCPWLTDLIRTAKRGGMTTMIVTNGTRLDDAFLETNKDHLDWIAISVDSLDADTNTAIGRTVSGRTPITATGYHTLVDRVKAHGYRLKVNTVVNRRNWKEDLGGFIRHARPERWKVLQALPIIGQNDAHIDDLVVSEAQFEAFVQRHASMAYITRIVPESNAQVRGSYVMVDPAGRFFDNAEGTHRYSLPILEVGSAIAIQQMHYDAEKFEQRGGVYDWADSAWPSRITISGEVASGKSTVGKLLAERLGYDFISIGNATREAAAAQGMDIVSFQRACLADPRMDKRIDRDFAEQCNTTDRVIIDYRLGFRFVERAYHVFLRIAEDSAVERLRKAGRAHETHHTLQERNDSFQQQFQQAYGIDYTEPGHYDLVIDVDHINTPGAVVERIVSALPRGR
ncbi:MAG: radical SAM protein [Flavobacteriales bacterium]|nr:radical SAM protein [Flavobacteriales bacterium]